MIVQPNRRLVAPPNRRIHRPHHSFWGNPRFNGVHNLNRNLTINGVTKQPFFRYKLGDANGTNLVPWIDGEILTLQAGTAPSYNQGSPWLGVNDDSCKFNVGGYYKAGSNEVLDIPNTSDAVIEIVLKTDAGTTFIICNSDLTDSGWTLFGATGTTLYFKFYDNGGVNIIATGLLVGTWNHVMAILHRPGFGQLSVNGSALGAAVDITGVTDTSEPDAAFTIGASSAGSLNFNGSIAYAAGWEGAGWLDSHVQPAVVKDRYARFCAYRGLFAAGDPEHAAATRTTAAFMEKIESGKRKLYFLGHNMVPWMQRKDGDDVERIGFAPAGEFIEDWQNSRDLASATSVNASVHGTKATSPDGETLMEGVVGDVSDDVHGYKDNITLTAAKWWICGFAKPGNKDYIYIEDATVANATAFFDIANKIAGTKGAGFAQTIMKGPYFGDSYWFACEVLGTAAAHEIGYYAANDNISDKDFAGDGSTANVYFDLLNVVQSDYPPMPIWSKGSQTTKTVDLIGWPASANIGGEDTKQGTLVLDMCLDNYDIDSDVSLAEIDNNGLPADSIRVFIDASNGNQATVQVDASGGTTRTATVAGDCSDGKKHTIQVSYRAGRLMIFRDGVPGVPITTIVAADIPDDLNYVFVLNNAIVTNVRCFPRPSWSGRILS